MGEPSQWLAGAVGVVIIDSRQVIAIPEAISIVVSTVPIVLFVLVVPQL